MGLFGKKKKFEPDYYINGVPVKDGYYCDKNGKKYESMGPAMKPAPPSPKVIGLDQVHRSAPDDFSKDTEAQMVEKEFQKLYCYLQLACLLEGHQERATYYYANIYSSYLKKYEQRNNVVEFVRDMGAIVMDNFGHCEIKTHSTLHPIAEVMEYYFKRSAYAKDYEVVEPLPAYIGTAQRTVPAYKGRDGFVYACWFAIDTDWTYDVVKNCINEDYATKMLLPKCVELGILPEAALKVDYYTKSLHKKGLEEQIGEFVPFMSFQSIVDNFNKFMRGFEFSGSFPLISPDIYETDLDMALRNPVEDVICVESLAAAIMGMCKKLEPGDQEIKVITEFWHDFATPFTYGVQANKELRASCYGSSGDFAAVQGAKTVRLHTKDDACRVLPNGKVVRQVPFDVTFKCGNRKEDYYEVANKLADIFLEARPLQVAVLRTDGTLEFSKDVLMLEKKRELLKKFDEEAQNEVGRG